jgi:hypothetical protein
MSRRDHRRTSEVCSWGSAGMAHDGLSHHIGQYSDEERGEGDVHPMSSKKCNSDGLRNRPAAIECTGASPTTNISASHTRK